MGESVILKRQTFNAQPVFGKSTDRNRQRSIVGLQQFALECLPSRSSRQKLLGIKRFASVGATRLLIVSRMNLASVPPSGVAASVAQSRRLRQRCVVAHNLS